MSHWSIGRTDRTAKPRRSGLTHVIDTGTPIEHLRGQLDMISDYTDVWKFGFGTSYLDATVDKKIQVLRDAGVLACVGGTLLEAAWLAGSIGECLAWAEGLGFPCVEVSNGVADMPPREKRRLIEQAASGFTVLSEVGSKDPTAAVLATDWVPRMVGDLEAGATWVIAEGRDSGTVGIYDADGSVRWELVERLVADVGTDNLVFEAPRRSQQVAFIQAYGPNVSLGNIRGDDVLALEALRRGLRADSVSRPGTGDPR